jgi:nucleotide-binding universal stress UspA family protein
VEEMPSSRYAYLTDASSKSIKAQEQKKIDANVKRIKSRVKAVIHKECEDWPQAGNRIASIQVIMGDPPAQILQTLDKLKSDILIIGTHSKGLIAQTFLGSAASKILQRIRIPVFVIPIPQETDISFRNE